MPYNSLYNISIHPLAIAAQQKGSQVIALLTRPRHHLQLRHLRPLHCSGRLSLHPLWVWLPHPPCRGKE